MAVGGAGDVVPALSTYRRKNPSLTASKGCDESGGLQHIVYVNIRICCICYNKYCNFIVTYYSLSMYTYLFVS